MILKSHGKRGGYICPRAFSAIELVVVVAICGILAALVVFSISSVRAAARRTDCQNRFRNVTLGMEIFYSQNRRYPLYTEITNFETDFPFTLGPSYQILPFLEESVFISSLASKPDGVIQQEIDKFQPQWVRCPADRIEKRGNLRYCVGSLPALGIGPQPFLRNNGVFGRARNISKADLSYGSDVTILVSERIACDDTATEIASMDIYSGFSAGPVGSVVTYELLESIRQTERDEVTTYCGVKPFDIGYQQTAFNTVDTPNAKLRDVLFGSGQIGASVAARSWHRGGVNVGFVSGAVQFVSDSIDRDIWRRHGVTVDL